MTIKKFAQAATLTGAFYGFAGWFYIAQNAVHHPESLSWQLTHFLPYPREDTFGAICMAVSIPCFFLYMLLRDDKSKTSNACTCNCQPAKAHVQPSAKQKPSAK